MGEHLPGMSEFSVQCPIPERNRDRVLVQQRAAGGWPPPAVAKPVEESADQKSHRP